MKRIPPVPDDLAAPGKRIHPFPKRSAAEEQTAKALATLREVLASMESREDRQTCIGLYISERVTHTCGSTRKQVLVEWRDGVSRHRGRITLLDADGWLAIVTALQDELTAWKKRKPRAAQERRAG